MEMLARNQLMVVNSFFKKRESHKITYRSGNNRTEIGLVIVRRCQRNKVRDCKVLAGEHITSQFKPLVYEMWIGRGKQRRRKQRQVIRWGKCEGEVMEKYKSEVDSKFGLLKEQREDVEAEWTAFKEGYIGTVEEISGRTSGKPTQSRKKKEQWWWNQEVEKAIQEKKEALKCVEEVSEAEKTRLKQRYREKKNAANKAVVKARDKKQQDWCDRFEEDGEKKNYLPAGQR